MVETVPDRLKKVMDGKGWGRGELADAAGVSLQAVHKWMHGGKISPAATKKLAKKAGVTEAWILFGDEAAPATPEPAGGLSPIAVDLARRWMALSSERQEWFRDLIFTTHMVEERFPAIRKGRPKGEHYAAFEAAVEKDMRQMKLKLE